MVRFGHLDTFRHVSGHIWGRRIKAGDLNTAASASRQYTGRIVSWNTAAMGPIVGPLNSACFLNKMGPAMPVSARGARHICHPELNPPQRDGQSARILR